MSENPPSRPGAIGRRDLFRKGLAVPAAVVVGSTAVPAVVESLRRLPYDFEHEHVFESVRKSNTDLMQQITENPQALEGIHTLAIKRRAELIKFMQEHPDHARAFIRGYEANRTTKEALQNILKSNESEFTERVFKLDGHAGDEIERLTERDIVNWSGTASPVVEVKTTLQDGKKRVREYGFTSEDEKSYSLLTTQDLGQFNANNTKPIRSIRSGILLDSTILADSIEA
jgi:hypothetical protein